MIPNIHQSIEEIIKDASSSEKILWQQIRLITGENAAIRQLHYMGIIAGSEFITFDAHRLYLALNFKASYGQASGTSAAINLYNEANALSFILDNVNGLWNSTAAAVNFIGNQINDGTFYFSRIAAIACTNMIFTGYRIIY